MSRLMLFAFSCLPTPRDVSHAPTQSKTFKGVRDWSVKARRRDRQVTVTIKVGRMRFRDVVVPVDDWPIGRYDQHQRAATALADMIGVAECDWESSELDRIPDEMVRAMNSVL